MNNIISVVVISYNSAKSILETLESVLNQTYGTGLIELIIADDGSQDDTVEISKKWLRKYADLFYSTTLLVSEKNKGVAGNCNLGWRNCSSSWIKTIAADDILTSNCLYDNFDYVKNKPEVSIVFSNMQNIVNDKLTTTSKHNIDFFKKSAAEQFAALHIESNLLAPTSFFKKSILDEVGFANEKYFMIEDYPLWFNITKAGYKLYYLNKTTVLYRNGDSLCQQNNKIGNLDYLYSFYLFQKHCIWPNLKGIHILKKWDDIMIYKSKSIWIKNLGNKNSLPYKCYYNLSYLLRPYLLVKLLHRVLDSNV